MKGELTYYLYSDEGLIAELNEQGKLQVAYGWEPNAMWGTSPLWQANIKAGQTLRNADYHYLHTDHIGTPQIATNQEGNITWQAVAEAFGETTLNPENEITMNLRFPGQYFDAETGTHYNYFRDYDPRIGRYQQSDPIGLVGGINFYGYVAGNPLSLIDPEGLDVYICKRPVNVSWIPRPVAKHFPYHTWIKTDTREAGLGGDCPVPGQGCADIPYKTIVKVVDHSGQSDESDSSCKIVPDIDCSGQAKADTLI